MKVYIVLESPNEYLAVYSTLEKAEAHLEKLKAKGYTVECEIIEEDVK